MVTGWARLRPSRSKRTIDVPAETLDKLDYIQRMALREPRRRAGAVPRILRRVWTPAVERAWPCGRRDRGTMVPDPRARPAIHDLRHTYASWMIAADVPLPVVSDHLGHESITTTVHVYGHLDRRSRKSAAEAIGRALERR